MAATADLSLKIDTGNIQFLPVKASTTIYQHAFVGDDASGYARGLVAGDPFRGIAVQQADNSSGSAGDIYVQCYKRVDAQLAISGLAITDVGKDVYASADDTATLTQGNNSYIGKVVKYLSSGVGIVRIDATTNGDLPNHQHTAATDGGPLTSPRVVTGINDTNGNELIKVTATGSAVNEITLANAATGNAPSITASGETNVDLKLNAKGTGKLDIDSPIEVGADDTGYDVKFFGATAGSYLLWDESEDRLELDGADLNLQDSDILQFGDAQDVTMTWDGTQFVINGAAADSAIHVGVDDAGLDLKLFGDTSGSYLLWDQSADKLIINAGSADLGTACEADAYTVGGVAGVDFGPAAPASITVVKGIVTAASS